jgi:hypothetical protein
VAAAKKAKNAALVSNTTRLEQSISLDICAPCAIGGWIQTPELGIMTQLFYRWTNQINIIISHKNGSTLSNLLTFSSQSNSLAFC